MARMTVYNVGQGLTVLFDFGGNTYGVVDCGVGSGLASNPAFDALAELIETGQSIDIAFLFLTHIHWDHISSIPMLFEERYTKVRNAIARFYCNGAILGILGRALKARGEKEKMLGYVAGGKASRPYKTLQALASVLALAAEKGGVRRCEYSVGSIGASNPMSVASAVVNSRGVRITALSPVDERLDELSGLCDVDPAALIDEVLSRTGAERGDYNSASGMLLIEKGSDRILVAGDATKITFRDAAPMLKRCLPGGANVIVAWHHGAQLGTSADDVGLPVDWDDHVWSLVGDSSSVQGKWMLVSCGAGNAFGHPRSRTVALAEKLGYRVVCTNVGKKIAMASAKEALASEEWKVFSEIATDGQGVLYMAGACHGDIELEFGEAGGARMLKDSKLCQKICSQG